MEPFLGGIYLVGFSFTPTGYQLCNGQLVAIAQNTALFSLLGTFYGGNGVNTFGLPDLRGRVAIHQGTGLGLSAYTIGETGGAENVTLLTTQIPAHTHTVNVNTGAGTSASPVNNFLASGPLTGSGPNASSLNSYAAAATTGQNMAAGAITATGGSQPHSNIQPFLCVTYIIAMQGVFPSRS